ncbi:MAG TPA: class I adenylate-forming enzyme family protein [Acidimicrobiales bacterium]|nr:class I adenylate-forming enzyme family protein [Acidimicrobiales bacterium]
MPLSYEEAGAQVTAPGQIFEVAPLVIDGVEYRAFKHAPASLRDVFAGARAQGDKTFLVYEDERWSFADVMRHVDALGAALVDRYGVERGDRVAIAMRNFPEWVVSFAAITSIGAVSVSLNAWWVEDELDYGLTDSGAKVLIADAERVERTRKACDRLGVKVIAVRSPATDGADSWGDVVRPGAPLPEVAVGPEDDATILYTSGTTGRPKGAVSTNRAVVQSLMGFACRALVDRAREQSAREDAGSASDLAEAAEQSFILVVPLFHVTGCIPVMMSCFAFGMKLVMMHRWDPERALELIERERVTTFVGVPTQSWDLLECPRFSEFDTSSLRSVGGGGAPAPPTLVKRVAGSFSKGRPNIGYGMTETNAYGPGNTGRDYLEHPTSTGRATPIHEISIRDLEGSPVPAGRSGEIWLKSPTLIKGYWGKPEATAETFVDGWLRTGDIGRLDEEGFLYIEDRLKDMILRAGENVYSAEVEAAIYEHPGVYEAAVFGIPHPRLGEEVVAVVVGKAGLGEQGEDLTEESLREHLSKRLAPFQVPSKIAVVDHQLPRNAAGKILKKQLRDELSAGGS